jgi:Zn finger protein HypA/HybF involved in hydrogenase expression
MSIVEEVEQAEKTVICQNCNTPRHVNIEGYVEKCPVCGNDGWNIFIAEQNP